LLDQQDEPPDYPRPNEVNMTAGCITIRNEKRRIPVFITAEESEAGVWLHDQEQRPRAVFLVHPEQGGRFELRNAEGKVIVSISEGKDGSGQIYVAEAGGQPRAGIRVDKGMGLVNVVGERNTSLAMLRGNPEGGEVYTASQLLRAGVTIKCRPEGGLISLFESSGRLMGFFGVNADSGTLSVYGPQGAMAAAIRADDDGGHIGFFDVEGELKVLIPEQGTGDEDAEEE
jgi:hypothetical protein